MLVIEGSDDGVEWRALTNLSNPGPLDRPCAHFAPYHHYLDFLLWLAGPLPPAVAGPWMDNLVRGLLAGHAPVYRLFAEVPWSPEAPPRYVRVQRYRYRYATDAQRALGLWWQREFVGEWLPPMTLGRRSLGWPRPRGALTRAVLGHSILSRYAASQVRSRGVRVSVPPCRALLSTSVRRGAWPLCR